MKWLQRLKIALGIARSVSPEVDQILDKAEVAGKAAAIAKDTADQVEDLIDQLRADHLVGGSYSPSETCRTPGLYGLVRRGELVLRFDGRYDTAELQMGDRFPPGLAPGDRWRLFAR